MAMVQTAYQTKSALYHYRTAVGNKVRREEMSLFQAFLLPSFLKVTDGLCIKDSTTIDGNL